MHRYHEEVCGQPHCRRCKELSMPCAGKGLAHPISPSDTRVVLSKHQVIGGLSPASILLKLPHLKVHVSTHIPDTTVCQGCYYSDACCEGRHPCRECGQLSCPCVVSGQMVARLARAMLSGRSSLIWRDCIFCTGLCGIGGKQ